VAKTEAERLELLLEVGRLLSSKLELSELLTTVLELASRVVDAETASLLLLDEKTQELYFDVALGLDTRASGVRLRMGQGIAGSVAASRKSEIINDVKSDKRWSAAMDTASGFSTRSILAVPILLKGRLVGVVEAINKRGGPFSQEDLTTFEAFASQAGVAIDNARLFSSLRAERFKLATIFSQMTDGCVLTDDQGVVLLANEAAVKHLGELADMRTALKNMAVTPSLPSLLSGVEPRQDFAAVRQEPTLMVLAGRVTWAPLQDRSGRLFVFREDTEGWRQERLKRSFLSLISHKLKTPLAAVTGFSEILLGELDGKADAMTLKAARTIADQSSKLAELVDKLLRYTTLESPDAQVARDAVPVDEAVADALKSLQGRLAAREARVDTQPSGMVVEGDRGMIVELLKNLVENAVKFDTKTRPPVAVRCEADGEWVAVSVADAGPGIPPEDQEKVFSRFHQVEKDFTGQQEGMGLGLAYVRKVAQLHGGDVKLISKIGEGTTVTVTLPRRKVAS
jgi:NtrC-family two-component system sensor histidine kinase KinB